VRGPKLHFTMSLACGQKMSKESELIDISVASISEETIQKPMEVYAINNTCYPAKRKIRDFKQIATAGANTAAGSKFPPK